MRKNTKKIQVYYIIVPFSQRQILEKNNQQTYIIIYNNGDTYRSGLFAISLRGVSHRFRRLNLWHKYFIK
jgi:hypothetical protein